MSDNENMAEAAVHPPSAPRFFCHKCTEDISPVLPDYICPRCRLGFVEEVAQVSDESEDDVDPTFQELFNNDELMEDRIRGLMALQGVMLPPPRLPRSSATATSPGSGTTTTTSTTGQRADMAWRTLQGLAATDRWAPPPILQYLLTSLADGRPGLDPGEMSLNNPILFTLHGNPGDYVWSRGNFDTIITHLLNQLDGTGPPPLPKNEIEEIPTVAISLDQVDKNLQCTVCMEDFKLAERVRRLKCDHHFHTPCITPWLELHGTCPICRCSLHEQQQQTTTDPQPEGPGPSQHFPPSSVYEYSDEFD